MGVVSIRIYPPAARVWIDQIELENPTERMEIQGREHTIRVSYQPEDGPMINQRKKLSIQPGERVQFYLDLTEMNVQP